MKCVRVVSDQLSLVGQTGALEVSNQLTLESAIGQFRGVSDQILVESANRAH